MLQFKIKRIYLACLFILHLSIEFGCAIKPNYIELTNSEIKPLIHLETTTLPEGIELKISIPKNNKIEYKIKEIRIYYDYLPINKKNNYSLYFYPLQLKGIYIFDLTNKLLNIENKDFIFLDNKVPINMQAIYEVVLIDINGHKKQSIYQVHTYRVNIPTEPKEVKIYLTKNQQLKLKWTPVINLYTDEIINEQINYLVLRKNFEDELCLNKKILNITTLIDNEINIGQKYSYCIATIRNICDSQINGTANNWLTINTNTLYYNIHPLPVTDFTGTYCNNGNYLRFNPTSNLNIASYYIERYNKKKNWERLNKISSSNNTYIDKKVQTKKKNIYRIISINKIGNESYPSQILIVNFKS